MSLRDALVDMAYFMLMALLVSYGLILVVRGYLVLGLSRLRRVSTSRS